MNVATEFIQFDRATDAMVMLRLFGLEQDRFCHADERLVSVVVPRVFPNTDNSLTIQYKLTIENRRMVTRRELLLCGSIELDSGPKSHASAPNHDHVLTWPDMNLSVLLFPFDPELKALEVLCSPPQGTAVLQRHAHNFGWEGYDIESYSYDVLSYRLGRRAVLRLRVDLTCRSNGCRKHDSIICRVVRPAKVVRSIESHQAVTRALSGAQYVMKRNVPEILAVDVPTGTYFMEDIPGVSLCDLTGSSDFPSICLAARQLLDRVHEGDRSGLKEYTAKMETEGLREKAQIVGLLFPEIGSVANELTAQLEDFLPEIDFSQGIGIIHRDFYDKQIVFSGDRVTLLDFDGLSIGDPAQDVGNFLGHCQLRQLQEPQNLKNIAEGAKHFLYGAKPSKPSFDARVVWWQAASLLRLALIYALRPRWRAIVESLLCASTDRVRNLSSDLRINYEKT